jgi:hypothetical protein
MATKYCVGDELTLEQLLRFNLRWSDADRAVILEELTQTGGRQFSFGRHGYMEVIDVATPSGVTLMHIGKGTIWFKRGYEPNRPGVEPHGNSDYVLRLSTHRAGSGKKRAQVTTALCERCGIYEKSVTGECPGCD